MRRKTIAAGVSIQQAIALLIQNEAALRAQQIETDKQWKKARAESERRFARIEADLEQIKAILRELPEAIRQKIRFQPAK